MRAPRADDVRRDRQHRRLRERDRADRQDGKGQQNAEQHGDAGELASDPVRPIGPVQANFGCRDGVEHAPIGADAAFECLPGLIDRLDDVVVDAVGVGAGDEIAKDLGLLQRGRGRHSCKL